MAKINTGQEAQRVTAVLEGDRIIVKDPKEARRIHEETRCGDFEEGGLILDEAEALYLLEKGKLRIINKEGAELTMDKLAITLAKKDPYVWIRYLVYSDLRKRGYYLKPLPSPYPCFMLYARGADPEYSTSKYLVYAVVEGIKLDFRELERISEKARRLRKELILAVLDRQGEIAYYTVSSITL